MNDYRNSSIPLATVRPREGSARRAQGPSYAAAAPALAGAGSRASSGSASSVASGRGARTRFGAQTPAGDGRRPASRRGAARQDGTAEPRTPARGAKARRAGSASGRRQTNFMRYAADNRFIQAAYSFMTGSTRPLFIALVALAVGVGLYFPVRDYYIAQRTNEILTRQVALRDSFNEKLGDEVDQDLSLDGIERSARELGMVLPGETSIEVTGGSSSDADEGDDATASSEALRAEQAVAEDIPWYFRVLDAVFFFHGVEGQVMTSAGEE
ncbi:FtsB family cell division protein [Collinsella tanakaei]|uniref:FtsB family cell division protein n=1 Tax=Collinsella tanakaei TaxID=626935 RepID=UPI0025A47CFB|nr:hypothetical protein [Collinsella tanakaei]MDM8300384.1 hypothetical protein [Collinsella tanakaei]